MELLLDSDFIIKMGRYSLLSEFEALALENGHAKPFHRLYEIRSLIKYAEAEPMKSLFRSHIVLNSCRSFVQDCKQLDGITDAGVLAALSDIEGVDAGEALLLEYALRQPDSIIITADKKMIEGLRSPDGKDFWTGLKGRILHLERVLWCLAKVGGWPKIRNCIRGAADCDLGISNLLAGDEDDPSAEAAYYSTMVAFERSSRGLMRASLQ